MVGLTILITLIMGMGSVAYIQNNNTQQQYSTVIQQEIKVQTLLKNIQYRSTGISNDQRAYLLTGDQEFIDSIGEKKYRDT